MKISEIITLVDQLRPNQYDEEQKTIWLSEVDGMVADDIINRAEGPDIEFEKYRYELDAEKETLLPDRFCDIYIHYLRAKMELYDDEIAHYNNAMLSFQTAYDSYAAYYRRTHMPKTYTKLDIWGREDHAKDGISGGDGSTEKGDWGFWGNQ